MLGLPIPFLKKTTSSDSVSVWFSSSQARKSAGSVKLMGTMTCSQLPVRVRPY